MDGDGLPGKLVFVQETGKWVEIDEMSESYNGYCAKPS